MQVLLCCGFGKSPSSPLGLALFSLAAGSFLGRTELSSEAEGAATCRLCLHRSLIFVGRQRVKQVASLNELKKRYVWVPVHLHAHFLVRHLDGHPQRRVLEFRVGRGHQPSFLQFRDKPLQEATSSGTRVEIALVVCLVGMGRTYQARPRLASAVWQV